jgi:hypothetical protein
LKSAIKENKRYKITVFPDPFFINFIKYKNISVELVEFCIVKEAETAGMRHAHGWKRHLLSVLLSIYFLG